MIKLEMMLTMNKMMISFSSHRQSASTWWRATSKTRRAKQKRPKDAFEDIFLIFKDWMPAFPTIFFYWCFAMLVLGKFLTLTRMVVVLTMTSLVMLTRMVAVVVVGMSPTLKMELQSLFFTCPPLQDLATCTVKDFRWVVNGHPWNISS